MSTTGFHDATWTTVAPLLARYAIALLPQADGSWDVHPGYQVTPHTPVWHRGAWWREAVNVPFAELAAAIVDVAARCEAALLGQQEEER